MKRYEGSSDCYVVLTANAAHCAPSPIAVWLRSKLSRLVAVPAKPTPGSDPVREAAE